MEELFEDYGVNEKFSRSYMSAINSIQNSKEPPPGVKELVELLNSQFAAEFSGVINDKFELLFLLPEGRDKYIGERYKKFSKCFKGDECIKDGECASSLSNIKNPRERNTYFIYRYSSGNSNNEENIECFEVIILKIPSLYGKFTINESNYIFIVNSPDVPSMYEVSNCQQYLDYLSTLVDMWVTKMYYNKNLLNIACRELLDNNYQGDREEMLNLISVCLNYLYRTLSTQELIRMIEATRTIENGDRFQRDFLDVLGGNMNLDKWHHCSPPLWPPCKGKDKCSSQKKLAQIFIEWTDLINENHIKEQRYSKNDFYKKIGNDLTILSQISFENIAASNFDYKSFSIDRKTLLSFFFHKAIDSCHKDLNVWMNDSLSDREMLFLINNLLKISEYLFSDFPLDSKTIEAIIWLISEYVHKYLKLPKRLDFQAHLLHAARGEASLHSMKQHYRDHFFHAIEVCLLGHLLLEVEINHGNYLWQEVAKLPGHPDDYNRVLRLWYLAALLHDIGYGIDTLKGVKDFMGFFKNANPISKLSENITNSLEEISRELEKEAFCGYKADDKPGEDHGIIGARHLMGLIEKMSNDIHEINVEDYMPGIRAIATHNSRKHSVSFKENPIGFLLILCDTIQEWNRLQITFSNAPTEIISKLHGYGIQEDDMVGPLKKVNINVFFEDGILKLNSSEPDKKLRFELEYDETINKNSCVFGLWIDATLNFQRLNFEGLGLDVEVQYNTPAYRNSRLGENEAQLYRLKDAYNETHMGFMEYWFPDKEIESGKGLTNGAVEYIPHRNKNILVSESLTLHLKKLAGGKWISKDMDNFWKSISQWQFFNEDRDFSGDYITTAPE